MASSRSRSRAARRRCREQRRERWSGVGFALIGVMFVAASIWMLTESLKNGKYVDAGFALCGVGLGAAGFMGLAARLQERLGAACALLGYLLICVGTAVMLIHADSLNQIVGGSGRNRAPLWIFAILVYGGPIVGGIAILVQRVRKRRARSDSRDEQTPDIA